MDKRYVDALQNLAYSFLELIEEMKNKQKTEEEKDSSNFGLFKGYAKMGNTLKMISKGISQLKDNDKKILSNQDTLMTLSKEIRDAKEKKNVFSRLADKKDGNKLKDGVKTIVMIAVGITAIGLAFKLIGEVDFISVMALSIALPLLAFAFVQIAKQKELQGKEIFTVLGVMVGISAAVWLSSIFLGMVRPIGLAQILTSIGIAAVFTVIGFGIGELAKDLNRVSIKALAILPVAMVLIATAIVASSYILGQTQPITGATMMNVIMASAAVAAASVIMFIPLWLYSKINIKDLLVGGLGVVVVAGAIMLSSLLLSMGNYSNQPSVSWALGAGLSLLLFTPAVVALGFVAVSGIGAAAILLGALATIVVAGSIMATSHILSAGKYENYPGLGWSLGAGASMLGFGMAAVALGMIMITGVGAIALSLGISAILNVAQSIVDTAKILATGSYDKYPGLGWALGVGMVMTAFGMASVMLGGFILGTFGLGGMALKAGNDAIIEIAKTIVATSFILGAGNYKGGPTKAWSEGISLAIGAFAPVYKYLMDSQVMSIFGGKAMTGEEYGNVMKTIGQAIIDVAGVFNKGGVNVWANAPTKSWAEGVGTAIGAFAPVYGAIQTSIGDFLESLFFGKENKAQKMSEAMVTIAQGIIGVAQVFATSKQAYVGGPTKEWADGVGQSLAHFSVVYGMLEEQDLDPDDIQEMGPSLLYMASTLAQVAKQFNGLSVTGSLPEDFTKNLTANVKDFLDLIDTLEDEDVEFVNVYKTANALLKLASAYEKLSNSLGKLNVNIMNLQDNQLESLRMVTGNIISLSIIDSDNFDKVLDKIAEKSEDLKELYKDLSTEYAQVGSAGVTATNVKKPGGLVTSTTANQDMAIKDLYSKLEEMNSQLKIIASNSGNLSSYVNELRGSDDVRLQH